MNYFAKNLKLKKALAMLLVAISLFLVSCGSEDESSKIESGEISDVSEIVSSTESGVASESTSEEQSDAEASSGETETSQVQSEAPVVSEDVSEAQSEQASEPQSETPAVSEEPSQSEAPVVSEAPNVSEQPSEEPSEESSEEPAQGVGDKNSVVELDKIPEYSGTDYIVIANNVPFFTAKELSKKGYETYGDLDSLGRCTFAVASVGKDTMPTGDRGSISGVKPTGWIQAKYDCIKTKDLYNRSHLIAWSLSGEDANKQNLVTGTAHLNQDVMTQFEEMVLAYIRETGNHVAYRVRPLFKGNELVCRGVQMEAYSVEDNGKGICYNVYCYNVQPGVVIDYATGESHAEGDNGTSEDDNSAEQVVADYVLNVKSKKIHIPECGSVDTMSDKNKEYYNGTLADLFAQGYEVCGSCNAGQ